MYSYGMHKGTHSFVSVISKLPLASYLIEDLVHNLLYENGFYARCHNFLVLSACEWKRIRCRIWPI